MSKVAGGANNHLINRTLGGARYNRGQPQRKGTQGPEFEGELPEQELADFKPTDVEVPIIYRTTAEGTTFSIYVKNNRGYFTVGDSDPVITLAACRRSSSSLLARPFPSNCSKVSGLTS